jgi:hypothetical protein
MVYKSGQRFLYTVDKYEFIAEIISANKQPDAKNWWIFTCKISQVIGKLCPWQKNQVHKDDFDFSGNPYFVYLKGQDKP